MNKELPLTPEKLTREGFLTTSIFGSKTKAQEIFFLLTGLKPVVRQGFYESELPYVEQFCKKNNIHLVKSEFKIYLAEKGGYSNKGIRLPLADPRRGMFFVYFSLDELKARQACCFEAENRDKELGIILGYPHCCVDFFCQQFNEEKTNLQLEPTNIFTNLTKRAEDVVLLSHFPCGSDCAESIALGKKYFAGIKRIDPNRADEIERTLSVLNRNINIDH